MKKYDVIRKRIAFSSIADILTAALVAFTLLTEGRVEGDENIKKYQKWIVNVDKIPQGEVLPVHSFE